MTLQESGYEERFIRKHQMNREIEVELTTVLIKLLYISLSFKGDNFSMIYKKKLKYELSPSSFSFNVLNQFS